MRRTTLAIAALGSAALLAVTGCGSNSVQSLGNIQLSAAEAVAASAEKVQEVTSYTVDGVANFNGGDSETGKVQGRMIYQGKPQLAVDINVDSASFGSQSLPGGARAILLGDTVYVKLDILQKVAGATKPWIKVPLSEADKEGVDTGQLLGQVQQFDLANATKMLSTSKDVKAVGTETVGGVETTHYSGTFPVDAAVAQLPAEAKERATRNFAELKNVKFDLWADAQSLPRKITLSGGDEHGKADLALEFKGFNEPADISAPPADQVGEFPKEALGRAAHN
ncbi:hypothetical protein SAMN05421505_14143 [Sinosporangium album]|uniref:Lipoprotein LprG n=1 Tax=Sinosporangium album TaxID=504805 RepID=A0A1G8J7D4_9ACTN|nr:DUF1396 domain-containing protein [Sinosporangium album]SDI26953.1 hypothetical protein SAMN05421505_14143 [Sinosporangium album]